MCCGILGEPFAKIATLHQIQKAIIAAEAKKTAALIAFSNIRSRFYHHNLKSSKPPEGGFFHGEHMRFEWHTIHHPDRDTAERLERIEQKLGQLERIMSIDTSKILAAVAEERTELASWKALAAAQTQALKDAATALAAANAANDPAAQAQVQADLDKAAGDLSADNADAAAAIAANTPPAA